MTHNGHDHIDLPDETFGVGGGVIVHRWDGEHDGREGAWLLVEIPKDDGTSYSIAEVFMGSEAGPELVDVSEFSQVKPTWNDLALGPFRGAGPGRPSDCGPSICRSLGNR